MDTILDFTNPLKHIEDQNCEEVCTSVVQFMVDI